MKLRMKTLTRAILATSLVAGLGFSQTALAESTSTDLDVNAGLAEALTLNCNTALSFGITRLETLARGSATTLEVPAAGGIATAAGDTEGVTASGGEAGACSIAGSLAGNNTEVTVTIAGETDGTGSVDLISNGTAFGPTTALTGVNALKVSTFTTNPSPVVIAEDGSASFGIGGTLTIPATVISANLGGYSATVTVEVADEF